MKVNLMLLSTVENVSDMLGSVVHTTTLFVLFRAVLLVFVVP